MRDNKNKRNNKRKNKNKRNEQEKEEEDIYITPLDKKIKSACYLKFE